MFFGFPEQARELRAGVRDVLSTACTPATVRAAWPGGDPAMVTALWRTLGELGLTGLVVPAADGGLGLDELTLVAALQEVGYAGAPGPVVETVAVAAPLLAAAGALPDGLLDGLLNGSVQVAVQRGEVVPYAASAHLVLQLDGDTARLLSRADAKLEPVATVDGSRSAARVLGTGTVLDVSGRAVAQAQLRGVVGTAAVLLGLGRRMLEITTAYVRERHQFGVPVGSFQAVKHPLADALVRLEFAEPAVLRAAQSLRTRDTDAGLHAWMAKALASDAAWQVAGATLQAHGAMAYTIEYDLQLFAKRAWALAADWGTAGEHRERIARTLFS